ncbi:hypothetical protein CK203_051617 [Vitis vinifera]|uniref:Uncharacterized protein n=1 Tax=Vitis vinifera TaxID=29760 RepID=A0A438HBH6_VITVI|nr:hypothetical protein CK203_051617 [Vitis vinifera]
MVWTASRSGVFSVKSLYSTLEPGGSALFPYVGIWRACVPPKGRVSGYVEEAHDLGLIPTTRNLGIPVLVVMGTVSNPGVWTGRRSKSVMGAKRKKSEEVGGDDEVAGGKKQILPSMIKNKDKRSAVHAKLKHQKKIEKRKKAKAREAAEKRALELGEEPPVKAIPRTIENTREFDETVCKPDDEEVCHSISP